MQWIEHLDARHLFSAVATLQNSWGTIANGPAHTGYVAGSTNGLPLTSITLTQTPGVYGRSIAVGDGKIFYSQNGNEGSRKVYALDARTQQVVWSREIRLNTYDGMDPPTYFNGRVYFSWNDFNTGEGRLIALDATDGRQIWATNYSGRSNQFFAPAVNASGVWIAGGSNTGLRGYTLDGTPIASRPQANTDRWTPTLTDDAVYAYTGTTLNKYDLAGNPVWTYPLPTGSAEAGQVGNLVAVSGDTAYLTDGQYLRAIDTATGTLRWASGNINAQSTPAIANGIVYVNTVVANAASTITAFRASDGSFVRSYSMPGRSVSSPGFYYPMIVTDDLLIAPGPTDTRIFDLNGTLKYTLPYTGNPAIDHERLYLSTTDSRLFFYHFGILAQASVFQDTNLNGIRDAGETGSRESDVGVYLDLDNSGSLTAGDALADNTDTAGAISFGVGPGTYTARLLLPPGMTATTADSTTFTVDDTNGTFPLPAFGVNQLHDVTGVVAQDFDANGITDHGPSAGITVYADLNHNGLLESSEPSAATDANGRYTLQLPAGNYQLKQVLPSTLVETARSGGPGLIFKNSGDIQVTDAVGSASYDFFVRPLTTLAVSVYIDTNADGTRASTDVLSPAADLVYVDLDQDGVRDNDEPSMTTQNGLASFSLPAGTYTVRVLAGDPARVAVLSGSTVTLTANAVNSLTMGLKYAQSVSGTLYKDTNGNGLHDPDETAFTGDGITAYLDLNGNERLDTGEPSGTAVNGQFTIGNLAPGTYTVRARSSTSLARVSAPLNGINVSLPNQANVNAGEFGVEPLYNVFVSAFTDSNANGVLDGNEFIVTGRKIYVDLNDNGALDVDEPSVFSQYSYAYFALPRGTYALRQVVPDYTLDTGRSTNSTNAGATFVVDGRVRVPEDITNTNYGGTIFYFGSKPFPVVSATAFLDLNGNGVRNIGETNTTVGGSIYLDANNNGVFDAGIDQISTAFNSTYQFSVAPGTYVFRQLLSPTWVQSVPAFNAGQTVTVTKTTTSLNLTFGRWQPLTHVTAATIEDGTAQRAHVRSIWLTFDAAVRRTGLSPNAFSLVQTTGNIQPYTVQVAETIDLPTGQTRVKLTFSGPGLDRGSLADGRYRLTIIGSQITDANGLGVDAANTGQRGSTRTIDLFRLSSDSDGNGAVDFNDFLTMQNAFGTARGDATYNDGADNDNNGLIDFNDFLIFQNDFGHRTPEAAPVAVRAPSKLSGVRK